MRKKHEDKLKITPKVLRQMGCEEVVRNRVFTFPFGYVLLNKGDWWSFSTIQQLQQSESGDNFVGAAVTHVSELIRVAHELGCRAGANDLRAQFRELMKDED